METRGRPTKYSNELVAKICARISEGKSVAAVSRMEGMPHADTIWLWAREKPEFKALLDAATQARCDALAEEMLDIPDEEEDVNRARLKVDTRKWIASRMMPKRYGDRTIHEGGDKPIGIASITAEMTPEEAGRLYKELISG